MNLTPPTDNLYKFLAISGILLVGLGLLNPGVMYVEHTERLKERDDIIVDVYRAQQESHRLLDRANRRRALVDSLTESGQFSYDVQENYTDAAEALEEGNVEYAVQTERLRLANERIELWLRLGVFGPGFYIWIAQILLGLLVALVGFILWYRRLQRYADLDVKKGHEKPRLIVESVGGSSTETPASSKASGAPALGSTPSLDEIGGVPPSSA